MAGTQAWMAEARVGGSQMLKQSMITSTSLNWEMDTGSMWSELSCMVYLTFLLSTLIVLTCFAGVA